MNVRVLRVLRIGIRADSDPARQALFANLVKSRLRVRLVFAFHARLGRTRAAALLASCYGLAAFVSTAPPRNRRARVVVVAKHANARRQAARVTAWIGPADVGWIRTGLKACIRPGAVTGLATLIARGRLRRTIRIVGVIDRRHGFLVSCRAASALAWYARTRTMLGALRPGAVLVSSDSNPEETGFVGAARGLGIPQVFVSHAYPTPFAPPLDFTLSILEGEAAADARRRQGPIKGQVMFAGVEGESAPMDASRFARPNPVIGIFTPKAISWPAVIAAIEDCRVHFRARRIVIRWHPSMLEPPRLDHLLPDRSIVVESPRAALLSEVAELCDWVIAAEHSNVHLQVMKHGIPTIAVGGLGLYPANRADMYGFVASGIVFRTDALRDVTPEAVRTFYANGWATRFQRFDSSYLRPYEAIAGEVRRAIVTLYEPRATQS